MKIILPIISVNGVKCADKLQYHSLVLTGQNINNERAQCDMREGTNFKGSDSILGLKRVE